MRKLIVGDLHLKKSRLKTAEKCFEQLREIAKTVDHTIFLGDQYHGKADIRSECQRFLLHQLRDWPTRVSMLVGNHDYENLECQNHALTPFNQLENVDIHSEPIAFGFSSESVRAGVIPYCKNEESFVSALQKVGNVDVIYAHQDVSGFKYESGKEITSGIKVSRFDPYKRVFLGHIHTPQEQKNIICVGTPFSHSFSEANQEKSVIIYDTRDDSINKIRLDLPRHIQLSCTVMKKKDIKSIKIEASPGDYIRLKLKGPKDVLNKITKSMFNFPNLSLQKIEIKSAKLIKIEENLDKNKMVEVYISTLQTKLDKEKLNQLSQKILKQVRDAN